MSIFTLTVAQQAKYNVAPPTFYPEPFVKDGDRIRLDFVEDQTARMWFTVEDDGEPCVELAGNVTLLDQADMDLAAMFGCDGDWRYALGIESWYDLMALGVAPGQAFRVEMTAHWYRTDGYEEPPGWDLDYIDCKVIERAPMDAYATLRAWGSVLAILGDGVHLLPGDKDGEILEVEP